VADIEQLHDDILMDTTVAADIIVDAIAKDEANVTFPFVPSVNTRAFQAMPHEIRHAAGVGLILRMLPLPSFNTH
jgi:hypothetical protein